MTFDDFLLSTSLLPEFTLSKKKVNNRISTTKNDANDKSRCKEIRDLYTASGMTQAELSKLTGITENTLSNWIIGKKQPATYVVNHIKMCISKYNKIETNNGDWVRQMDNDTLAEFLAEIRDNALKTKGVEGDVREEFKSFDDFLESTSHVSNYRTSKCGSLI